MSICEYSTVSTCCLFVATVESFPLLLVLLPDIDKPVSPLSFVIHSEPWTQVTQLFESRLISACVFHVLKQVWLLSLPDKGMACCTSSPRLCSRSSAYTLALGLGFVTMGTSRILLLKFSANAGEKYISYVEIIEWTCPSFLKKSSCWLTSVLFAVTLQRTSTTSSLHLSTCLQSCSNCFSAWWCQSES